MEPAVICPDIQHISTSGTAKLSLWVLARHAKLKMWWCGLLHNCVIGLRFSLSAENTNSGNIYFDMSDMYGPRINIRDIKSETAAVLKHQNYKTIEVVTAEDMITVFWNVTPCRQEQKSQKNLLSPSSG
jgi:hypothetical protein